MGLSSVCPPRRRGLPRIVFLGEGQPGHANMHPVHSTLSPTGCGLCALRSRRLFTSLLGIGAAGLLGVPAQAQQGAGQEEGLRGEVGRNSRFTSLVPAEQLEAAAAQQYQLSLIHI